MSSLNTSPGLFLAREVQGGVSLPPSPGALFAYRFNKNETLTSDRKDSGQV